MTEISREDFDNLVMALASLCDSQKRLETAINLGAEDRHAYVEEARSKRYAAESCIVKISAGMRPQVRT